MSISSDRAVTVTEGREALSPHNSGDELSLFDLWAVLVRRRAIAILTTLTVIALAGVYAFVVPSAYMFSTAIEIGSYVEQSNGDMRVRVPLELPNSVRQRLEVALVPMARREFDDSDVEVPKVSVGSNDSSEVVAVTTEVPESRREHVVALHQRIADLIVDAHKKIFGKIMSDLEQVLEERQLQLSYIEDPVVERSRIQPLEEALAESERRLQTIDTNYQTQRLRSVNRQEEARFDLADLRDQQQLLKGRIDSLEKNKSLLQEEIRAGQAVVEELLSSRANAPERRSNSSESNSVQMISGQVDQARSRVQELQNRVDIVLAQDLLSAANDLDENARAQRRVASDIEALGNEIAKIDSDYKATLADQHALVELSRVRLNDEQLKYRGMIEEARFGVQAATNNLADVTPTRVLFVALSSPESVGPGKALLLSLGAILGTMLGIFCAFGTEFVSRANQYIRDSG